MVSRGVQQPLLEGWCSGPLPADAETFVIKVITPPRRVNLYQIHRRFGADVPAAWRTSPHGPRRYMEAMPTSSATRRTTRTSVGTSTTTQGPRTRLKGHLGRLDRGPLEQRWPPRTDRGPPGQTWVTDGRSTRPWQSVQASQAQVKLITSG